MVLKSFQSKFRSPNENDKNDPTENHGGGSSQNSQQLKRRSTFVKKRNSRRCLTYHPTNSNSRSLSGGRIVGSLPLVQSPVLPVPAMNPYYRGQNYGYPVTIPNWNIAARMRFENSWYRTPFQPLPVPVPVSVPHIINPRMLPPMCPFPGGYTYPPPAIAPMLPPPVIIDELPTVANYYQNVYSPEQIVPNEMCDPHNSEFESVNDPPFYEVVNSPSRLPMDNLEFYLSLPKELFPNAMMLSLDPNPIIDGFCKYNSVMDHAPWIMDLEFGVPREATTRTIAMYDVKYNSVQCKNAPNAIHPGFEICNPKFKSTLTFYYDCVISNWYRGYIILSQDRSVDNFQSWLAPPMQEFGMCWS